MPKSPDPAEAKKQLEAMAGQELDITPEQVNLTFPLGAHDVTDGVVASRLILPPRKFCTPSPLLDASGATSTGAAGNVTFLLSNVICLPPVRSLAEPINLLATAHTTTPFYVTATHALVGTTDVQITLFAWDAKGSPAPNVSVHWRCRVVSNQIIG
ncbi:MAG TPA: hypothetical protein VMJ75_06685 [Candidatus Acidoferrales bacterium]|nr:hypothetical protein [Candidatus Acidoferrales bacterium]